MSSYPSGRVAIVIISISMGQYTYLVQDDCNEPEILAVFEPTGYGCCYFANGKVRLVNSNYFQCYLCETVRYSFTRHHVHIVRRKTLSCNISDCPVGGYTAVLIRDSELFLQRIITHCTPCTHKVNLYYH